MTTTPSKNSDVCQHCLFVHAMPSAGENFEDDRGFSIHDLSMFADPPTAPLRWDTITLETQFAAALDYMENVAADYLRAGDVICECGE